MPVQLAGDGRVLLSSDGKIATSNDCSCGCCDCCFANRIRFTATVTATVNCAAYPISCPCDAGDFTVTSDSLSVNAYLPCNVAHAQVDGGTNFICACPSGSPPHSASHAEIFINSDGVGGCWFVVIGWIDFLNCSGFSGLRLGLNIVTDSMTCDEVFGDHSFDFEDIINDGNSVHVIMNVFVG